MKRIFRILLSFFLATSLGLLLVEGLVRIFVEPPRYWGNIYFDPDFGFRMKPGLRLENRDEFGPFVYRLNREGFRSPELPAASRKVPDGKDRLVFLGDSFLNAWAVREEHLMTSRTRKKLLDGRRTAEVFSLCGDGYGTGQELLLLREFGPRLAPDAVILALFPGNDLFDNTARFGCFNDGDYLRPYLRRDHRGRLRIHYLHPTRAFLRNHSRTFAVVEHRLISMGLLQDVSKEHGRTRKTGIEKNLAPVLDCCLRQKRSEVWESAWAATEEILRAFRDEVQTLGARFLVLVIPSRFQVQQDVFSICTDSLLQGCSRKSLDEVLDWNLPERRLAAFFTAENIDARFLLDPLRAATRFDRPEVFVPDGHLSWRGHEIAADLVAAWFLEDKKTDAVDGIAAPSGHPVTRIPSCMQAPTRLDLRTPDHAWALGAGWGTGGDQGTGRHINGEATLIMPLRSGDLVLRGTIPPGDRLPVTVHFGPWGAPPRKAVLKTTGPFEMRFPKRIPGRMSASSYGPVRIHTDRKAVIQEIAYENLSDCDTLLRGIWKEIRQQGKASGEVLVIPSVPELYRHELESRAGILDLPLAIRNVEDKQGVHIGRCNQADILVAITMPEAEPKPPLPAWVLVNRWLLGRIPPGPPPQLLECRSIPIGDGFEVLLFRREGSIENADLRTLMEAILAGNPQSAARMKELLIRRDAQGRRLWAGLPGREGGPRLIARFSDKGSGLVFTVHGPPGFTCYLLRSEHRRRRVHPFAITELEAPENLAKGFLDRGGKTVFRLEKKLLQTSRGGRRVYIQALLEKGKRMQVTNWVAVAP